MKNLIINLYYFRSTLREAIHISLIFAHMTYDVFHLEHILDTSLFADIKDLPLLLFIIIIIKMYSITTTD